MRSLQVRIKVFFECRDILQVRLTQWSDLISKLVIPLLFTSYGIEVVTITCCLEEPGSHVNVFGLISEFHLSRFYSR